tara:strand:- start:4 stop:2346 length:2343 start_codon:yes stop_codon:yes gene_type:complete
MAILKTYPLKSNYYGPDRMILSDMEPDSQGIVHGNTKNITMSNLKSFIGSQVIDVSASTTDRYKGAFVSPSTGNVKVGIDLLPLTTLLAPNGFDYLLVTDDPSGNPINKKTTVDNFFSSVGLITNSSINYTVKLPNTVGLADQVLKLPSTIGTSPYQLEWSNPAGTGTVIGSGTTNYIPKWNSSTELTDSIVVSGASNISVSGVRPISMNSATGAIDIKGPNAGWATGYLFTGSSGTNLGGFGALGSSDTLSYYWIGDAYDDITMVVQPNGGNVGIGTSSPTAKLEINGNLKLKYPTSSGTFALEPNASNNSQYSLILPTIPSSSDGSKFLQLPSSTTGLQQFQLEWADPRLQVATNINKTRSLNPGSGISMISTDNGLNVTISSTGAPGTGTLNAFPYWNSTSSLGSSQLTRINNYQLQITQSSLTFSDGNISIKQGSGPSVTLGSPTTAGTAYQIKLPQIPTVAAGYTGGMGLKLPDTLGSSPFQLEWQQPNTKFKDVNSRPFIDGNLTGGISMQQGTGPTIKLEATSNAGPATTYLLPPASQSQAGYVLTLPTGTITSPYQLAWTNASSITSTNNVTASANSLNLQGSSSVAPTYGAPLNISSSGGAGSGNQTAIYIDQAATANVSGSQGIRMNFKTASIGILVTNADSQFANVASFRNASNQVVGTISCTNIATTYATSSDYRIKENVVDMTGAVDRVKQLKPSRFNFTANPSKVVDGFLAHEAQKVVPESVTGVKDALYSNGDPLLQGIDQSKIVPLLTGAIKELIARIEVLEAK